jgi:hypothetical protein
VGAIASGDDAYLDWIGYSALKAEVGDALPTGEGVRVAHVEVAGGEPDGKDGWAPDAALPEFAGKRFILSGPASAHATEVARLFYGNGAVARGIAEVECYPNAVWAYAAISFLRTGRPVPPLASPCRVANHSWNAKAGMAANLEVLKRVDFVVERDDFIQVGGANNNAETPDVMQCSYNAIIVGRADGHHSLGTNALDKPLYCAGRAKPDLVAPARFTSEASPIVASAAAFLVAFAHGQGEGISNGSYVSPRTGMIIWRAETAEAVKAALMAGADRQTPGQPSRTGTISQYRSGRARQTSNGLDARYGAGQVNVRNSYYILAAGEQDSAEDSGPDRAGRIGPRGFDYDPAFGGAEGSNRQASYFFKARQGLPVLKAALVWNVRANESPDRWDGTAALYDLDLKLFNRSLAGERPAAKSISAADNTENLCVPLTPGDEYELRVVVAANEQEFLWDYALAWEVVGAAGP